MLLPLNPLVLPFGFLLGMCARQAPLLTSLQGERLWRQADTGPQLCLSLLTL